MASTTCASPLTLVQLVPAVPLKSLCQIRAPYTPVTACPVIRYPTDSSQKFDLSLVLVTIYPYDASSEGLLAFTSLTPTCAKYFFALSPQRLPP
jgi:hypothetical protein